MEAKEGTFKPNYSIECFICGQKPTVDIYDEKGEKLEEHMELCGPCCFGEAECIDPEKW